MVLNQSWANYGLQYFLNDPPESLIFYEKNKDLFTKEKKKSTFPPFLKQMFTHILQ